MTTWKELFPTNIDITTLPKHESWAPLFTKIQTDHDINIRGLNNALTNIAKTFPIFPYPNDVFNAFTYTTLDNLKVVILGQDPYPGSEMINNIKTPQAMGLSFSVPDNINIPASLRNVFKNLKNFNHIPNIPTCGNLTKWAQQGCLLLNTALTVTEGTPGSHTKHWEVITDTIIKYISDNTTNVMFVLWGAPAIKKLHLIDTTKHQTSISSHPSYFSCYKPVGQYPSFSTTDHFGACNTYLSQKGKTIIDWTL
jgi:uracil-DNA glycosylase